MDEVIADAAGGERLWLAKEFGYAWEDAQLKGRRLKELISPEHAIALEEHLHRGEFFSTLRIVPGSYHALQTLASRYDIFITTAAMEYPASLPFKFRWLIDNSASSIP